MASDPRDAFLRGDAHYCDLCKQAFETLEELADHDCPPTDATTAPDGGSNTAVRGYVVSGTWTDGGPDLPRDGRGGIDDG